MTLMVPQFFRLAASHSQRIIGKVHVRSSSTFTEAEQQQLQSLLSLNPVQLSTVLGVLLHFEKAIYENEAENLEASLVALV